ncbi:DUF962 domain-containing protein [Ferrimicrobium sp.]|uniref:DUF962 domain-containing protein n=1 Tax=Ferrimicrobium sp. TaxID=2926050 RepID=UPI0026284B7E|nr:DUF962 domain-containing protein [Ferrimicrobium sp.]
MTDEFWLRYLRAHSRRATRVLHYFGSTLAILVLARARRPRDLLGVPLAGYVPAWFAHFFIERNRPETFTHPLASLLADYRMLALAMTGRLGPHLARAQSATISEE